MEETEIVETESCLLKEGKATKNQLFLGQRSDPFIYGDPMPFCLALSSFSFSNQSCIYITNAAPNYSGSNLLAL